MAEEVHDPSQILPQAMTWSVPIGTISGIIFLLPVFFTLPDVKTLLAGMSLQFISQTGLNWALAW